MWLTGLAALRHVGSSRTGARTCVPCTGRRTPNHCATREAPLSVLEMRKAQKQMIYASVGLLILKHLKQDCRIAPRTLRCAKAQWCLCAFAAAGVSHVSLPPPHPRAAEENQKSVHPGKLSLTQPPKRSLEVAQSLLGSVFPVSSPNPALL